MDDKFYLALIDKFEKSSITELEFTVDKISLRLRKGGAGDAKASLPHPVQHRTQAGASEGALSQDEVNKVFAAGLHPKQEEEAAPLTITAPIVATYYSTAVPDSPPFVKKGDKVKKGQTLCILEAMKMMNHLEAEYDCEILDVKASSGDLVEFGQTLFEVKKS